MPRVFSPEMLDEAALAALDALNYDESDPFSAPPSAFQFLPAPEFGGPEGKVHVAVKPSQVGQIVNPPSAYDRILKQSGGDQLWRQQQREWEAKAEAMAAAVAAALADLGATRAYCRYDGGNDEGFAWLDHCVLKDGSTREVGQIVKDLQNTDLQRSLGELGAGISLKEYLEWELATYWAGKLLSEGFGTGEYVMYGAFSVDLETGDIVEDIDPAPIVKNITLKLE